MGYLQLIVCVPDERLQLLILNHGTLQRFRRDTNVDLHDAYIDKGHPPGKSWKDKIAIDDFIPL